MSNLHFNSKIKNLITIILISISTFLVYQYTCYNNLLISFKDSFDNYKFSEANNILMNNSFNLFKNIFLSDDLKDYFNKKIDTLSLNEQNIDNRFVLTQLNEINRYNIIPISNLNNIYVKYDLDSKKSYDLGLKAYNDKKYSTAIDNFEKVNSLFPNYNSSLEYIILCKDELKKDILNKCDNLISKDYYTNALNLINSNSKYFNNDVDLITKINEIKEKRQCYLDTVSNSVETNSKALLSKISPENINSLNIKSNTNYLINVSISDQKTYVYNNKDNKWNLEKTFPCCTGLISQPTPTGSFTTKEKGDWFYSEEYKEGGKYWTQITGDILFHSQPYSKNKTDIVDKTIGMPASHGCIRLYLNDSKWIYDNIPRDTKVIIK